MTVAPCGCGVASCGGGCITSEPIGIGAPATFAHAALVERMTAALGTERALDGLTTRDTSDPALAVLDAYAGALHVLAFTTARIADDGSITTSSNPASLLEITRLIGYTPRPALSASSAMAFQVGTTGPDSAAVPSGTQIATVPRNTESPITFETETDLLARRAWNVLQPVREMRIQVVTAQTATLAVDGVDVRAGLGDAVLVRCDAGGWLFAKLTAIEREAGAEPPRTMLRLAGQILIKGGDGPGPGSVLVLGVRASAFGALAPDRELVIGRAEGDWPGLTLPDGDVVDLSSVVKEAIPGAGLVFIAGSNRQVGRIKAADDAYRAAFGLSGPVTRLHVEGVDTSAFHDRVRDLAIFLQTQRLSLLATEVAGEATPDPETPDTLHIRGPTAPPPGRTIALTGFDAATGAARTELAVLAAVQQGEDAVTLTLAAALHGRFLTAGLSIAGNVVDAVQGRTPANPPELLGSSSALQLMPVYKLSGTPVAYTPDSSVKGYGADIQVRVSGRAYAQVDSFLDLADDRAWRLRQRRDGAFEVQFAGRLPTGANNVTAAYRVGGGAAGNVEAGRISMIMTPVPGVIAAANVAPAQGGADPAGAEEIRRAGDAVTIMDRVVALADFERFALAYRGVGKAKAVDLREGMRHTLVLTIAASDDGPPTQALIDDMSASLLRAVVPGRRISIVGFTQRRLAIGIAFSHDPARIRSEVEAGLRTAITRRFAPAARNFGQALYASEVLAAAQEVTGVVGAIVALPGADPIAAGLPRFTAGGLTLAELVSVDPNALTLTEMPV